MLRAALCLKRKSPSRNKITIFAFTVEWWKSAPEGGINWNISFSSKAKLIKGDRVGFLSETHIFQGINFVDNFIYLGSRICNDGNCVPEIKRRISGIMAKDAMTRLHKI